MTFDPFGDFAARGYLRNTKGLKDPKAVKLFEHTAFRLNISEALKHLRLTQHITYNDLLSTHRRLFSAVYPWAGQTRAENAPDIAIAKSGRENMFAHPADIRRAVEFALGNAADPELMKSKPGEILGLLAHAHPFLEGNGRTIMTAHSELCRRAGFHIEWSRTEKAEYLRALTLELEHPDKGHLDHYLAPYIRDTPLDHTEVSAQLRKTLEDY